MKTPSGFTTVTCNCQDTLKHPQTAMALNNHHNTEGRQAGDTKMSTRNTRSRVGDTDGSEDLLNGLSDNSTSKRKVHTKKKKEKGE